MRACVRVCVSACVCICVCVHACACVCASVLWSQLLASLPLPCSFAVQKHRHSLVVALEEKAREQVQSHLQQTIEEAAAVRAAKDRQSIILKQVRGAVLGGGPPLVGYRAPVNEDGWSKSSDSLYSQVALPVNAFSQFE